MQLQRTEIIRRPHVTEKSTGEMESNRYRFEVDTRAGKDEIKRAVEEIYKVKVVGVNTQLRKGETKRRRYGYITTETKKYATVRLREGDVIELF